MLNQVIFVGRLVETPREIEENTRNYYEMIVELKRHYKNENGEYASDIISCVVPKIFEEQLMYMNVGDLIGIKGRIETFQRTMEIVVEKLTFLAKFEDKEN